MRTCCATRTRANARARSTCSTTGTSSAATDSVWRYWNERRQPGLQGERQHRKGHSSAPLRLRPNVLFGAGVRSEEHTSELQSLRHLVCRLLLEKKKIENTD